MKPQILILLLTQFCCLPLLHAKDFKVIEQLPKKLSAASAEAHKGWDTGVTSTMKAASYHFNETLLGMIKDLVKSYYPKDYLSEEDFTDYLKALYTTRRFRKNAGNPSGESQGTIAGVEILGEVSEDLEEAISEMVEAIVADDDKFDLEAWKKKWEKAQE